MGNGDRLIRLVLATGMLGSMAEDVTAKAVEAASPAGDLQSGRFDGASTAASGREIVVEGRREDGLIEGIPARDELGEDDIAAMGLDSVGEIIEELGVNLDRSGEGPVVLINGELAPAAADIADLPPEALKRIQLLPPSAAVRLGAARTRPVMNIVLRRKFRQKSLQTEARTTTLGGGNGFGGEIRLTAIRQGNRDNISLKLDGNDALLEAERAILSQQDDIPTSFGGIVLPSPLFGQEIDPALSAAAGKTVARADVPSSTVRPTLADFVATADRASPGDLGRFRTLRPRTRRVSLNATFARRFSQRTNLQFYLRGDYSTSQSLNGATRALLVLPPDHPASPFTHSVTIARYLADPLEQEIRGGTFDLGGTLGRRAGNWQLSLSMKWVHGETNTLTDRGLDLSTVQTEVSNGSFNPFGALPADLAATLLTDPARRLRDQQTGQFLATGPLFPLPAGPITASFQASGTRERSLTRSTLRGNVSERRMARDEASGRGGLEIPLIGQSAGSLSVTLSGSARSISNVGTFTGYGYGVDWQPLAGLRIEGGFEQIQIPPSQQTLTDPVIARDNVRVFDFLRNETAEVRFITGGNANIATERRRSWTVGARLRATRGVELSATWARDNSRDAQGALPPPNAEVQAAFPDRYRRDTAGRLIEVDGRAVSFASIQREELRWGFTLRRHIGSSEKPASEAEMDAEDDEALSASARNSLRRGIGGARVNAAVQHVWTLASTRQARAGLAPVDLLAGGAAGYGGGLPRHRVEFRAGVSTRGVGLQLSGDWTAPSEIRAGNTPQPGDLRFSGLARFDLRVFADLARVFPGQAALKGTRLTIAIANVLNGQTIVRDRNEATPLSYQRYLLDPLGRAVSVSLRKTF